MNSKPKGFVSEVVKSKLIKTYLLKTKKAKLNSEQLFLTKISNFMGLPVNSELCKYFSAMKDQKNIHILGFFGIKNNGMFNFYTVLDDDYYKERGSFNVFIFDSLHISIKDISIEDVIVYSDSIEEENIFFNKGFFPIKRKNKDRAAHLTLKSRKA